jgi:Fe-S-cluster-containing hydrogenase component 2
VPHVDLAGWRGLCVKHCPVEAMRMGEERPSADRSLCISCSCCQEMCPEDAIMLSGRMINFIRKGTFYGAR